MSGEHLPDDNFVYQPGQVVDGLYQLVAILGEGGMGLVFKAQHIMLDQVCAIKILSSPAVTDEDLRRFEVEVRSLAKLEHPGIVRVFNMGRDRGRYPYYAMELIDGISLAQYIKKYQCMDVQVALEVFKQLAEALARAHALNIVHRDIKPSNIMLLDALPGPGQSQRIKVKLVDFGIASLTLPDNFEKQSLTAPGVVLGTPLYMSPEQSAGKPVDKRADIYSLACSMFETLSGAPPYKGESSLATLMLHQNGAIPSVLDRCPDLAIPADLDLTLQKMMAKEPALRLQSMEQVAQACQRLLHGKNARPQSTGHFANKTELAADAASEGSFWLSRRFLLAVSTLIMAGLATLAALSFYGIKSTQRSSGHSYQSNVFQKAFPAGVTKDKKEQRFFSKIIEEGGVRYRIYDFPADDVICKISVRGEHVQTGIGRVKIPEGRKISLWMSGFGEQALLELACFVEDPIWEVHISDVDVVKLGNLLARFKELGVLKVINSKVGADEIAALEKIPGLCNLSFENCQLDENALVKSDLLNRIDTLSLGKGSEGPAIYKTLQTKKQFLRLCLEKQKVTAEDLACIAQIKTLIELDFADCNLDAAMLVKQLQPLRNSKKLEYMRIYNHNWDVREATLVRRCLPRVIFFKGLGDNEIKNDF